MIPGFEPSLALFFDRLRVAGDRLVAELEHCWRDASAMATDHRQRAERMPAPVIGDTLAEYAEALERVGNEFLAEVVGQWQRKRPVQRALEAMQAFDRSLEELLAALPETALITGPRLLAALPGELSHRRRAVLVKWQRKERPASLRTMLAAEVRRLGWDRVRLEAQLLALLLDLEREIMTRWHTISGRTDAVAGRLEWDEPATETDARRDRQAVSLMEGWRSWPQRVQTSVAMGLLPAAAWLRPHHLLRRVPDRAEHMDTWALRGRLSEAVLRTELDLHLAGIRVIRLAETTVASLDAEREGLTAELDRVRDWIVHQRESGAGTKAPDPGVDLAPASSRLAELEVLAAAELMSVPEKTRVLAGRRIRELAPRRTAETALRRHARAEHKKLFEEVESEHRLLLQEIERARQVVSFGIEAGAGDPAEAELRSDALDNAMSLLSYYRDRPAIWQAAAQPRLVRAYAATFSEARVVLTRHTLGAFRYLAQQGIRRAWPVLTASAMEAARAWSASAWRWAKWGLSRFLVAIGWAAESRAGASEVVARPILPSEFTARGPRTQLPAIYRHLFRTDPVKDPRFLVGRETELAAIGEARAFWESGRSAAVLLVGERGSGKTSLINCAMRQSLGGLEVIQGEFRQRVTCEADLRVFLSKLLHESDPSRLEEVLGERRRVIILEEMERTFLRAVSGFKAVRALQRLVAATCGTTLWIFSLNEVAFRLLDAAVNLGAGFSHRINAGTASRNDLRFAVLQRHKLSGLRLNFAPPPPPAHRYRAAIERLRGGLDPEDAFFDELSAESGGVYRTAFDIWLAHIEAIEAGALRMKPLVAPDIQPVVEDLDQPALFTLAAVLEHGSLAPDELAMMFELSLIEARARIDNLRAREVLEEEPHRPGYRVRPQATRLVREALYQRNLL